MRSHKSLITILALSLLTATTAFGGSLVFGSGAVSFPTKAGASGVLKIVGPEGFHHSQTFAAGETLSFSLYGADGYALADGLYKWNLAYDGKATGERDAYRPKISPITGVFSIQGGAFVNPNVIERLPNKDQQILDDLIVAGSVCAGFDCVNGESFGFDTLRLKENNLRIHFQDTSVSASFPSTDWRLVANETSNGGANLFAIEDSTVGRSPFTIEGGAPADSLYVEDGGRVGLGTDTPIVELHIANGDTPTVRLEQDGTSGFTPQTFDIAANEANFFVRDVTNGSRLVLKIKPDSPTSSIFVENGTGDIGFQTEAPTEELHIFRSSGNAAIRLQNTTSPGADFTIRSQGSAEQLQIRGTNLPVRIGVSAQDNLLNIGTDQFGTMLEPGQIHINGSLFINGTDNSNPDYVFESDYELESIEEHAEFMWKNKHLPAVGAGVNDKNGKAMINVANRSQGMLEELEKAHIYIEQLHNRLEAKDTLLEDIQARLEALEGNND